MQSGQIVILDGGTTAEAVVAHLPSNLRATIVTHSPTIAAALEPFAGIEVVVIGGRLFRHSMVTVGAVAMEAIGRITADLYLMGVTGVDLTQGLTTGDLEEAAIKRALSERAAETIVMASAEKIGAAAPYLVLPIDYVDAIVTDADAPEASVAALRAAGITVRRA